MGSETLSVIQVRLQNIYDNDKVALLKITCNTNRLILLTHTLAKSVIHTIKLNGTVFLHIVTSSDFCPTSDIIESANFTTMPVLQNGGYIWELIELTHCFQTNGLIDDNCEVTFSKRLSDSELEKYSSQLSDLLGLN
uniref:Non-structural protein 1 n=1 Tax=Ovine respiratory syncytial virus (strain WSU 83-1578) TaxID=79699 RepID=NS1_ORSVW|nr:RecName: Full=Non-structural protein 1; AltName: Full=Non-structural protein 1C [Ovine respiratory syncytial virus (strain WSU 83-1578)]AAA42803.1 nonstructural protein [Ovine respiratory syncytial virus]